jgi:hypothetical protein
MLRGKACKRRSRYLVLLLGFAKRNCGMRSRLWREPAEFDDWPRKLSAERPPSGREEEALC